MKPIGYGEPTDTDPWDEDNTVVVRPSDAAAWCHMQNAYRGHPDYKWSSSPAIVQGTVTHKGIEEGITSKCSEDWADKWGDTDLIRDEIHASLVEDGIDPSVTDGYSLYAMCNTVISALNSWQRVVWDPFLQYSEVLAMERQVRLPLGVSPLSGRAVVLRGTADLVLRGGVWDWKTSGKGWREGKGIESLQPPLYAWLNEDLIGTTTGAQFTFWIYNVKDGAWSSRLVTVTDGQVEAAKQKVFAHAIQQEGGLVHATPYKDTFGKISRAWHCHQDRCPAWEPCQFKHLVRDDHDLNKQANTGWQA